VSAPVLAEAPVVDDAAALKATVKDLRDVGTAMFSWLTDQVAAAAAAPATPPAPANPVTLDVGGYPLISVDDLRQVLVPEYIAELPERDGWGHPFEFHLNRASLMGEKVMLIRSPGRDGKFETDEYKIGPYEPTAYERDLVWADGYFITWPGPQK
jgi:hypothetical protein